MSITRESFLLLGFVLCLAAAPASAEVADAGPGGFTSRNAVTVPVDGEAVWTALTRDVGRWWDPGHSYFGDASRFTVDPSVGGSWIEDAGDGRWARHLVVVYADPGHLLRMRGALGPLQGMAVIGALTFEIDGDRDASEVTVTYAVGGYSPTGMQDLAPVVDRVLKAQLVRLAAYLEK